jgi:hypothetical protein
VQELDVFRQNLPKSLEFSERVLILQAYSPMRQTLIMMHVWWRQCFCDLYRFFFPRLKESLKPHILQTIPHDYADQCKQSCYEHANQLTETFQLVSKVDSSGPYLVTDPALAICAYQCARILSQNYQISLNGVEISKSSRREKLQTCSDILGPLRVIYAVVERIVSGTLVPGRTY